MIDKKLEEPVETYNAGNNLEIHVNHYNKILRAYLGGSFNPGELVDNLISYRGKK